MFLPVVDERDMFDAKGVQVDDINTLYEYIDQEIFQNHDDTPEDEDDDNGHYFQVIKIDLYFASYQIRLSPIILFPAIAQIYPSLDDHVLLFAFFEVPCPPPNLA